MCDTSAFFLNNWNVAIVMTSKMIQSAHIIVTDNGEGWKQKRSDSACTVRTKTKVKPTTTTITEYSMSFSMEMWYCQLVTVFWIDLCSWHFMFIIWCMFRAQSSITFDYLFSRNIYVWWICQSVRHFQLFSDTKTYIIYAPHVK